MHQRIPFKPYTEVNVGSLDVHFVPARQSRHAIDENVAFLSLNIHLQPQLIRHSRGPIGDHDLTKRPDPRLRLTL